MILEFVDEAGAAPMNRLIHGKPGLVVDKRCQTIKESIKGGYHFKRVQISGGERYRDQPKQE